MADISASNKRIVKNTLLLYFRMLFMMAISLYTSRVILNALGVVDYGIYNVVGGVVAMFSMISGSLSAAITRFITYELGYGKQEDLKKIFSTAVTIQTGLAILVIILAEVIGVWFLNMKMNIPATRMIAANWVFQFSILTFVINLVSVPYNACIIAHERMSAFAYISILEAVGKLLIAFLIIISPIDRLIFYAIMMFLVALIVRFTYGTYSKKHFEECQYSFILDKILLKRMCNFAGWNFIGASAEVLRDQGSNIIINIFCGPVVNAARGIAFQVNAAVNGFVTNFMTALNPQIIKSYASGDKNYMMTLVFQGARLSFYLLLFLSLPILINTHFLLELWLKIVPEHAVPFVQLVLVFSMCESISKSLMTAMLATGKIRNYQIIVGSINMLNLPISYMLLRMGMLPESVFFVAILLSLFCLAARIILLQRMVGLSSKAFLNKVCINVTIVTILSAIPPIWLASFLEESLTSFLYLTFVSLISTGITIYFVGCNKEERKFVLDKFDKIKHKYK